MRKLALIHEQKNQAFPVYNNALLASLNARHILLVVSCDPHANRTKYCKQQ